MFSVVVGSTRKGHGPAAKFSRLRPLLCGGLNGELRARVYAEDESCFPKKVLRLRPGEEQKPRVEAGPRFANATETCARILPRSRLLMIRSLYLAAEVEVRD